MDAWALRHRFELLNSQCLPVTTVWAVFCLSFLVFFFLREINERTWLSGSWGDWR